MALKLDNALLDELGLGALPESEKQLLLRQIYEKLEMNVGMRLADQMSNEQLDAFEKFVDSNDDKGAFQWLEGNFPNYKQVVNEEFEKLKVEIRSVAPQILAGAQQAAQNNPQIDNQANSQAGGQPVAATQQTQPQYQQPGPQYAPQQGQQAPMQPQYAQPPQQANQQQPAYATPQQQQPAAVPQNGHLQPQYGAPAQAQPQQQPYQQPQYPQQPPQYGQQPPAGPPQQ